MKGIVEETVGCKDPERLGLDEATILGRVEVGTDTTVVIVLTYALVRGGTVDPGIVVPGTVPPLIVFTGTVDGEIVDPGRVVVNVTMLVVVISEPGLLGDGPVPDELGIEDNPLGPLDSGPGTVVTIVLTNVVVWPGIVDAGIVVPGIV